MKNKRLLTIVAIITIAATLTGCVNPNADQPASWNPLTWGDSVKGCASSSYQSPDGKTVVLKDGDLTPDGKWMCVSKGPDGPWAFVPVTATATPTAGATPTPAPTDKPVAPKDVPIGDCNNHGTLAYNAQNTGMKAAVIGGPSESCSIVGQIFATDGKGYVIVLGPTQWIRLNAIGGTGWYVDSTKVEEAIIDSVNGIVNRGEAKPTVVRFDKDGAKAKMPGLVEFNVGPKGSK